MSNDALQDQIHSLHQTLESGLLALVAVVIRDREAIPLDKAMEAAFVVLQKAGERLK